MIDRPLQEELANKHRRNQRMRIRGPWHGKTTCRSTIAGLNDMPFSDYSFGLRSTNAILHWEISSWRGTSGVNEMCSGGCLLQARELYTRTTEFLRTVALCVNLGGRPKPTVSVCPLPIGILSAGEHNPVVYNRFSNESTRRHTARVPESPDTVTVPHTVYSTVQGAVAKRCNSTLPVTI